MDEQLPLAGMDAGGAAGPPTGGAKPIDLDVPPRLRRVDRSQTRLISSSLDELLAAEHQARTVWRVVERLDLSRFESQVAARGSGPGRAATDPRILVALWLYAALDGVGSGREIDRLRACHDAYRWLAGGVSLNYHTINDFRVGHEQALDGLLTQVIATLVKHGLVGVTRIAQDGMRVRANAGSNTFRSASSLRRLLDEAGAHVEALKRQNDPALSAQQQAKRLADAQDREARLTEALAQLPALREAQQKRAKRSSQQKRKTRVSTTDPDARVMKMPDGGFRPAYNVQLATDTASRAIVGVEVVNAGGDGGLDAPMRDQVEERSGGKVQEHLVDGGYTKLEAIDQAEQAGVTVYAPVNRPNKPDADPHARKTDDTDATFAWRQRMATDEAKAIYKNRGATIETVNADLAQHRGLRQFPVRGSPKVRCVALWLALAYNILHFSLPLIAAACEKS
jgi:transposase